MKKFLAILELYLIILLMPGVFAATVPSSSDENIPPANEIKDGLDDGSITMDKVAQWANQVPPKLEIDTLWFRLSPVQKKDFLKNKNTDVSKFEAKFKQEYGRNVNFNSIKASTDGSKVTLEGGASLDFSQLSLQDVVNAIQVEGVGLCWEVNGDKLCGNIQRQSTVPGTTDTSARDTYSISDDNGNTFNVDLSLVDPQDRDAVYVDSDGILQVPKGARVYAQTTGTPFSGIDGPQYSIIPPQTNRVKEIFTTGRTNIAGNTFQFTQSWQADTVRAGTPQGTAYFNCQADACSSSLTFAGNDIDIRYTNVYDPENREFKTTFNYIGTFTPGVPIKNWQVASKKDGDVDIKLADSDSELEQAMANNPNLDAAISFDLSHARDAGADKQQRDAIMLWKPGWVPNLGPDAKLTANLNGNEVAQAVSRIQNTGINLRPTVPPEDIESTRQRIDGYLNQGNYQDALRLVNRFPAPLRSDILNSIRERAGLDPDLQDDMKDYYAGLVAQAETEMNQENQVAFLGTAALGVAFVGSLVAWYYSKDIEKSYKEYIERQKIVRDDSFSGYNGFSGTVYFRTRDPTGSKEGDTSTDPLPFYITSEESGKKYLVYKLSRPEGYYAMVPDEQGQLEKQPIEYLGVQLDLSENLNLAERLVQVAPDGDLTNFLKGLAEQENFNIAGDAVSPEGRTFIPLWQRGNLNKVIEYRYRDSSGVLHEGTEELEIPKLYAMPPS